MLKFVMRTCFLPSIKIIYECAADTRICKRASFVDVVFYEILSILTELSTQVTRAYTCQNGRGGS